MIFGETFLRNTPSFDSAGQGAGSGNRRPKYPGKMTLYHLIINANAMISPTANSQNPTQIRFRFWLDLAMLNFNPTRRTETAAGHNS